MRIKKKKSAFVFICILSLVALAFCYTACGSGDGSSSDADTGSDTDSDTDTNTDAGEWITIPPGSFWMGSPDGDCPTDFPEGVDCDEELGRNTDEDLHYVVLTRSFEIQSTEVTQSQYEEITGWNPSFWGPANSAGVECGPDCPVERVTWYDAIAYANELSKLAKLTPCYVLTDICKRAFQNDNDWAPCRLKARI